MLIADEDQIGVIQLVVRKKDIDGRIKNLSQPIRTDEHVKDELEISRDVLMPQIRRRIHDMLTSDDLVTHAIRRHAVEILPGDCRGGVARHGKSLRPL
jgi:hypothetical protein